jgi:hypothetical protein
MYPKYIFEFILKIQLLSTGWYRKIYKKKHDVYLSRQLSSHLQPSSRFGSVFKGTDSSRGFLIIEYSKSSRSGTSWSNELTHDIGIFSLPFDMSLIRKNLSFALNSRSILMLESNEKRSVFNLTDIYFIV